MLRFEHKEQFYLIASEMSFDGNMDLVVYGHFVTGENKRAVSDQSLKKEIVTDLIDYLKNEENLRVHLFDEPDK